MVADGQVRAAFPARVQTETRTLDFGGAPVSFTVTAASVGNATFAVGHARVAPGETLPMPRRAELTRRLAASAYANLGVTPPADPTPGRDAFMVRGAGRHADMWSLVKIMLTRDGVVQAIALGREGDLSVARAREFIDQVVMAP